MVEASDTIPLDGGKTGHGFVVTTRQHTSKDLTNVHLTEENGAFAIRRQADFVTKDGVLTFADVTLRDGKKLPVSLRLEEKKR
jgi:UV DNA damage repair endonuclease